MKSTAYARCLAPVARSARSCGVQLLVAALAAGLSPLAGVRAAGEILWSVELQSATIMSEPTVGPDGTIYLYSGRFYAVAPDGNIRWSVPTASPSVADVGPDGSIYVGSEHQVLALDPLDGALRWAFTESPTGQGIMAGPTVGPDGNIYAIFDAPGAGAVSLAPTGALRWAVPGFVNTGGTGLSRIQFAADRLYFAEDIVPGCDPGGLQEGLVAVTFDGGVAWCRPLSGVSRPQAGQSGVAYVRTLGGVLRAIEPDGDTAWLFSLPAPANSVVGPGAGPDSAAYLFRNNTELWAIDPSGSVRWTATDVVGDAGFPLRAVVAADNGAIVYGTGAGFGANGSLFAVEPTSGAVLWTFVIPGQAAGVTAAVAFSADGAVAYVPVRDAVVSRLLAVRVRDAVAAGDTNCDGGIDFFDIDPFLLALFDQAAYAAVHVSCNIATADVNGDGAVNFFDIDPFLRCLFGGWCP